MIIKVKGYLTYRDSIGQREIAFSDDIPLTLIEFLKLFAAELNNDVGETIYNAETSTIEQSIAVMCNGRHYNHLPDKLNTILQHNDEIALFPPAAGG